MTKECLTEDLGWAEILGVEEKLMLTLLASSQEGPESYGYTGRPLSQPHTHTADAR